MRTLLLLFGLTASWFSSKAQNLTSVLEKAVQKLEADSQMEHAIMTLQVVNSNTGSVVYSHNANLGLAAASSQKVITASTAFDLLGKNFRYKTTLGYNGNIVQGTLNGNVIITGLGDPTLGSDRFASTKREVILDLWIDALAKAGISKINGTIYLDNSTFSFQPVPGGWIWDDIGNYYGAGHWGLNWHENQYDLVLKPGNNEGDKVEVVGTEPTLQVENYINLLSTGKKGSGDNGYIYLPPYGNTGFVNGTVPAGASQFTISGSFPNPSLQIEYELDKALHRANIHGDYKFVNTVQAVKTNQSIPKPATLLVTYSSPPLDSIVYWFLKKSINLYGEALVKTIANEKTGYGGTEQGLSVLFNHWDKLGLDSNAIRMVDGSGLSPQNRITSKAFVNVMLYARTRPWFNSFYYALPEYNGLKMKSGTIGGTKSFTGYVKSSAGIEYTFAIIINNYTGKASRIVQKMYKVLDVLK